VRRDKAALSSRHVVKPAPPVIAPLLFSVMMVPAPALDTPAPPTATCVYGGGAAIDFAAVGQRRDLANVEHAGTADRSALV
jgi:hypothetical protein